MMFAKSKLDYSFMQANDKSKSPIGIFDSGIGGLTVAHAIVKHLPKEHMVYFGDTAHLPYGEKSAPTLQAYSIKIAQMLLQQNCKLIMIACNSASAAAYDLVKEYIGNQAIVMNAIDPVVKMLKEKYPKKRIGLIGTRQTVNSHVYKKKIDELNIGIDLSSFATNLLASAIEEFGNHQIIDALLKVYLSHPNLQNIDALVLACTHYPIIKDKILAHYESKIDVIDPSDTIAHAVKKKLEEEHLINSEGKGEKLFYLSDYTESFANGAKIFFNEDIKLQHYPLWD